MVGKMGLALKAGWYGKLLANAHSVGVMNAPTVNLGTAVVMRHGQRSKERKTRRSRTAAEFRL